MITFAFKEEKSIPFFLSSTYLYINRKPVVAGLAFINILNMIIKNKPNNGLPDLFGKLKDFIPKRQRLKYFIQHVTENLTVEITVIIVFYLFQ